MSQRPGSGRGQGQGPNSGSRNNLPVRQVPNRPKATVTSTGAQRGRNTNVNAPARRDPFPYIMGGLIGAMVVGLLIVVYLLTQNNQGNNNNNALTVPTPTVVANIQTPEPSVEPAPRMPMADFKKLYDSSNRPLIIDVRAKEAYDQGHIRGSISFPEADVDARINELPKDKLIIAYCS